MAGAGIQYGPVDPTLPPPWTTLVDGNTGYIYYWNTETNVTQYEKPVAPFPVGLPPGMGVPGSSQAGAPDSQKRGSVEMIGATSGNMPEKSAFNSNNGQSIHGMGTSVVHTSSMVNNSQPNLHVNPRGSYGNFTPGHHGGGLMGGSHPGGGHMAGNGPGGGGNIVGNGPGAGHLMENSHGSIHNMASAPRNGPSMSGATMHMNAADNAYGGAVRPMLSGGPPQGIMGGNIHPTPNSNRNFHVKEPMQPKLAALPVPQMQQGIGGRHMPVQSRQMNYHGNSPAPGPTAPPGHLSSFKRPPSDYMKTEPQPVERPGVQGFAEQAPILDVDSYRQHHEISVNGDNVPPPLMSFEAANFPSEIAREFQSAGFLAPTPIQAQSWPLALQGRDLVAIAKTGSGKTLGYLLPAFLHLGRVRANPQLGPVVLVLSPTRELATQIQDEALKFGKSSRLSCTCVYGGAPKGPQLRDLDRGADIVIATPGRLNDFLEVKKVSLRQVSYLVLDEADRMLDMGFEPQIRKIVKEIPRRRQTLMFTATWPKEVRKIAEDFMANPVQVNIGNADELAANKSITQYVEFVSGYEKQGRLDRILRSQEPGSKVIIFCSTKKMCDQLARGLGRGFGAVAIHGDKSQSERDHVLAQFKNGSSPILVATDVAARGLDIKDIRVVINFDFPTGVEDYVHRIGRTGRAGASGVAYSFFTEQDAKHAKELIGVLEGANQKVPMELRNFAAKTFYPRGRGRWEAGGMMGGRDGGRGGGSGSFGGNMGGRGGGGGGRSDSYGGRGGRAPNIGHVDRLERPIERYSDKDKSGGWGDRSRPRDISRKYGAKDRGRSYSRSPSRSWGRSRSHSRSISHSRSRSRSYDRHSDDRKKRSPYRGRGSYRSRSPRSRSPRRSRTPPRHGKVAVPAVAWDPQQGHPALPDVKLNSPDPSLLPSLDLGAMISTSHGAALEASLALAPDAAGTPEAPTQQLDQGISVGALNGEDGE